MENSPYVDPTLKLFRKSKERYKGVGIAIQAYLYRTAKDIESLIPLGPADPHRQGRLPRAGRGGVSEEVGRRRELLHAVLPADEDDAQKSGTLLHIATHDIALADRLLRTSTSNKVPSSAYEFAMLYGIQRSQQQRLAQSGRRIRVLISYGEYWFPWYMRRLAERPGQRDLRAEEPRRG
jgi:proline dehydrogenase